MSTVTATSFKPKATRKRLKKEILSDDFKKRKIFWKNIAENFPYWKNFLWKIFHLTSLGVRQGCLLSPLLFLVVIDKVMRAVTADSVRSITWKLTQTLEDLDYADEIHLLPHKFVHKQDKINDLQQESIKAGLKINIGKTKELRINTKNKNPIQIDDNIIENVENFTYLGSNVSIDGGAAKDVNLRIQKARGVFARMNNIWRANCLSTKTKFRIFNACVKSVLLYGCETWYVTRNIERKLQSFINRCLRSILRI
jgi:hypothetical protein